MANNTKLHPWRQYSEVDVFNMSAYSGSIPATAGTLVTAVASGWRADDAFHQTLGAVGASYPNVASYRWGTLPCVKDAGTGDVVLGMLLNDVREQDENGLNYKFAPRKAAENNVVLSGQTVPIVTKGFFLVSGVFNGPVAAGAQIFASGAGNITTNNINQVSGSAVGKFWGATDSQGYALIRLDC